MKTIRAVMFYCVVCISVFSIEKEAMPFVDVIDIVMCVYGGCDSVICI